ncbi:CDP-alcohol phosphatidyltransferase family protein [Kineosporia sp. J2-2]|uniref:CDP-alcohol phosphatidyltransferase family protein n=1 Tax=Kineosporia corallincola TaxID=2835133 RepID=A0ABS5TJV8_9ACTN|nr:CDP-alcohol phosphatidyltransferase family protein [Kineosporia corallincola]MBT0770486.1 CDP-alcohol phosphatidyltransferase family protein [Kineosporia corallincola]
MSGPTIAELRRVAQPEHVRSRAAAEHWVAHAYLRQISPYLTRPLLAMGLSANQVTWLMITSAALAALSTAWTGLAGALLAAFLVQLQMLFDCSDGEVARWRGTSSPVGVYLDRVGHYVAECGIALALGVRVANGDGLGHSPAVVADGTGWWAGLLGALADPALFLGALLALLVALNKVENDLVHVSRHYAGMPAMKDVEQVRVPSAGAVRTLRRVARLVPFHRVFHSVELTLLILAAAVIDLVVGGYTATEVLLVGLVLAGLVTLVGHLAAVLSSARLR